MANSKKTEFFNSASSQYFFIKISEFEDEEDITFLEKEAFVICEEDGDDGLTWKEVSDCIVSHVIHTWVLIICVEFRVLPHLTYDLSQTEKKIEVVTS